MKLVIYALLALFLFGEVSAQAATPRPPEDGVWIGTLGKQEVVACFEHYQGNDSSRPPYAAYFYRRHGKLIELTPPENQATKWVEKGSQGSTGAWSFSIRGNDWLDGLWTSPTGGGTTALHLKRAKLLEDYFFGCGSSAEIFNPEVDRLLRFQTQTFSNGNWYQSRATFAGKGSVAMSAFHLNGDGEGMASLNERLANEFRWDLREYLSCPIRSTGEPVNSQTPSEQPEYHTEISVLFRNTNLISLLKTVSGDCGGAYPFVNWSRSSWDLQSGNPVDFYAWFKSNAIPPKLYETIAARAKKARIAFNPHEAKDEPNCLDALEENKDYQITLGTTGLVFSHNFPHVIQACNDSIEIEYNRLKPFLSAHGIKQVGLIYESMPK
jgi:hypothetical protein